MFEAGNRIEVWTVERPLGQGGMGAVYQCYTKQHGRAAVKVLGRTAVSNPNARFLREAAILNRLDHPNIVKIREIRIDADPPYLVMDLVEGIHLGRVLKMGGLPRSEAISVTSQVADALGYAHERGVYHRDIKPSNVLLQEDGTAILVDFGIALSEGEERLTRTGQLAPASIPYSPPEWLEPENADGARWDIYGLGVVLYELLTGTQAFPLTGDGPLEQRMFRLAINKQQHPPLDPGADFSGPLRALIRQMTQCAPEQRPRSMSEVLRALRSLPPAPPDRPASERPAPRAAPPEVDPGDTPTLRERTAQPRAEKSAPMVELTCPECQTPFDVQAHPDDDVVCPACMSEFPVRTGIITRARSGTVRSQAATRIAQERKQAAPPGAPTAPEGPAAWELEVKGPKGESLGTLDRHLIREQIYAGALKGREQIRPPGGEWAPLSSREEFADVLMLVGVDVGALRIADQKVQGWKRSAKVQAEEDARQKQIEREERQKLRELAQQKREEAAPRPMWHFYVGAGVGVLVLLALAWILI